jgi:hypothetical protein
MAAGAAARFVDGDNGHDAARAHIAEQLQRVMPRLMIMLNDDSAPVRVASKRSLKAVGLQLFKGCDALATLMQVSDRSVISLCGRDFGDCMPLSDSLGHGNSTHYARGACGLHICVNAAAAQMPAMCTLLYQMQCVAPSLFASQQFFMLAHNVLFGAKIFDGMTSITSVSRLGIPNLLLHTLVSFRANAFHASFPVCEISAEYRHVAVCDHSRP